MLLFLCDVIMGFIGNPLCARDGELFNDILHDHLVQITEKGKVRW